MAAKPIPIDKQQKIVEMSNQGYKTREISKKLGVSVGAVSKYSRGDFEKTQPISATPVRETSVKSAETQSIRETPVKSTQYIPKTQYNLEYNRVRGIPVDDTIQDIDADAIIQARQGIPIPPIPPKDITLEQFIQRIIKINEKRSADIAETKRKQDEKEAEERQKQVEERRKQRKAYQDHQDVITNLHGQELKDLVERAKNMKPLVLEKPRMTDGELKAWDDYGNTRIELLRYEHELKYGNPIVDTFLVGGISLGAQIIEAWQFVKESKKQEINPKRVKLVPA